MRSKVLVNGAFTVVNAIASWKGAAIGLDFNVEARAEPHECIEVEPDTPLIRESVKLATSRLGVKGAKVEVRSEIPVGWGLKSSSAVSNAAVLAVLSVYEDRPNLLEALKLAVKASRISGVTITGALDDAAASMFGGLVVTDNRKDEILLRVPIKEMEVAILLPEGDARLTSSIDAEKLAKFAKIVDMLIETLPFKIWEVMTLNGLLYSQLLGYSVEPALRAIEKGALGAGLSGTGPAIVAVCNPCDEIVEEWGSYGDVMRRKITNRRAEISKED